MPQLHVYVPERIASVVRERARARGMTVSGYLAELVGREVASDWPRGYFDAIVGGWEGKPLRRPLQGAFEGQEEL
jgi:hypothetical protein